jgi:DNA-binding NarL/FixJ family response regulator
VALVDDHSHFRAQLAAALARHAGAAVVFEAADGVAAEAALRTLAPAERPDALVLDVDMPRGGGIVAARRIHALCPALRIVALSMHDDPGLVAAMTGAGAQAYVAKGRPLRELIAAIRGND